jgi:hypothetical protein
MYVSTKQIQLIQRIRSHIGNLIRSENANDQEQFNTVQNRLKYFVNSEETIVGGTLDEFGIPVELTNDYRMEPTKTSSERIQRLLNHHQHSLNRTRNSGRRSFNKRNTIAPAFSPLLMTQLCLKLTEQWLERRKFFVATRLPEFLQSIQAHRRKENQSPTTTANQLAVLRRVQQDLLLLQQLTDDLCYIEHEMGIKLLIVLNMWKWMKKLNLLQTY